MMHKLVGKLKSGLGEASFWTNKISKIFEERYGIRLFPGTLNIEIEKDYIIEDNKEKILPNEYNGNYNVLIQKCKIFDSIVYIVRPEVNNVKGRNTPFKYIRNCIRQKFKENI